jgi:uncharacterized membrane protein YdjX (TVP38/TMEM64 family)
MKFVLLLMLLAIIVSLGSGLFFLYRDQEGSSRVLKALKLRVALSILLIATLLLFYGLGWVSPGR